jgi:hypothetical protein
MAIHTIHIESTADENHIELRSAARWARGLGCTLRFSADGPGSEHAQLEIDDRIVRFARRGSGADRMWLEVQVATAEDRVTLLTKKSGEGVLVVRSESDSRSSDEHADAPVQATIVLYLSPPAP